MRLAALALLALAGCSSAEPDVERIPVPTPLFVGVLPCSVVGTSCKPGETATIQVAAGLFGCLGYSINGTSRRQGTTLRIALRDVTEPRGACLTANGPARGQFGLGSGTLPETLDLELGARVDRYRLAVVRDTLVLLPVSTRFSVTR